MNFCIISKKKQALYVSVEIDETEIKIINPADPLLYIFLKLTFLFLL